MNLPKVIFIDWYKTLSVSIFWEQLESQDKERFKLIVDSYLTRFGKRIDPWMRGEFSPEEFSSMIPKDTGIDENYVFNHLKESANSMELFDSDVIGIIKKLKNEGIKVAIATDNMDTFSRWTVPAMGLEKIFDGILNSWNLNAMKRDFKNNKSLFFDDYLKINNLDPKDCVLIDDSTKSV